MADPAQASQVVFDGSTTGSVGLLSALGFVAIYALREIIALGLAWWRARLRAPATAIGSSSGAHRAQPKTDTFENRPRIEDHYFFVTIDQLAEQHVPKLRCGCEVRTELLRAMMTDYLVAWKDYFTEFCNVEIKRDGFESRGAGHASGFSNRTAMMLLDLQNEISARWSQNGVPLEAASAFRKWNDKLVEALTFHSEKIAQSAFFPTNRERLVALLTQHATFLATTMLEARYVLRRMNGGLDGVMYKRRAIEPIDSPHEEPEAKSDEDSGHDAAKPRVGSGKGQALTTKKNRSGEWRDPSTTQPTPKKPSHSEIRLRVTDPDDPST